MGSLLLDGTHLKVNVPKADQLRYRTRKYEITNNVLRVYSQNIQLMYILFGWEGSAHYGRVRKELNLFLIMLTFFLIAM